MRHLRDCATGILFVALLAGACFADEPPKFYKLDFVVKEVDGAKVVNTRAYTIIGSASPKARPFSIRTGGKVPYFNGKEYTDLFVGVDIDCMSLTEEANGLSLWVGADISSVPESASKTDRPFVRQNRWGSNVLVPVKKPTVIFSSDDPTSKQQMQLELTATPIP